jgi:hypothetical protein
MSSDHGPEPVGPESEAIAGERPRVHLSALYAAAMTAVTLDPAGALADYEQSLADLIAARRARGD